MLCYVPPPLFVFYFTLFIHKGMSQIISVKQSVVPLGKAFSLAFSLPFTERAYQGKPENMFFFPAETPPLLYSTMALGHSQTPHVTLLT